MLLPRYIIKKTHALDSLEESEAVCKFITGLLNMRNKFSGTGKIPWHGFLPLSLSTGNILLSLLLGYVYLCINPRRLLTRAGTGLQDRTWVNQQLNETCLKSSSCITGIGVVD